MTSEESHALPVPSAGHEATSRSALRSREARLYARLLVSDIRLYHEEEVILGRAHGDLASRLKDSIDAARALFLRRFENEAVLERELVSILAGGDARRLGRVGD